MLWLLAAAGLAVLIADWRLESGVVFGPRTAVPAWLAPIELNPAAGRPLLPGADLHALWFFDADEGLAAGESGTLLRTTDGGRSWMRPMVDALIDLSRSGLYVIYFRRAEPRYGAAGGRSGVMLETEDRGASWTVEFEPHEAVTPSRAATPPAEAGIQSTPQQTGTETGAPRDPRGSYWPSSDIVGLALDEEESGQEELYLARRAGVETFGFDGEKEARRINQGEIRDVVLAGRALVVADRYALSITFPRDTNGPNPVELVRHGDYRALAERDGKVLAAGDRFRIEDPIARTGVERMREGDDAKPAIHDCSLGADSAGWAVGEGGAVWLVTPDKLVAGGADTLWVRRRDVPGFTGDLFAVWAFTRDAAVVAGKDGAVFRTEDGGVSWTPLVRNCWPADQRGGSFHLRLPAPLTWLALGLLGGLGWWRWRRLPAEVEERDAVAEELTTDRPLEPGEADRLNFAPLVQGLSAYLRNTATQPPLTLAVTGAWGAGKSSFMNLLRADLEARGLRTVWFNAWHHQQEPQILVPLLSAIQAESAPPLLSDKPELALRFRWRLLRSRLASQRSLLLGAAAVVCFALGVGAALGWRMPYEVLAGVWARLGGEELPGFAEWVVDGSSAFGTLAGVLLLAWRVLKTFGVSPADLLATEAGRNSGPALNAQTEFRRQFADEFREVTGALKPYPLVIFIDDLDRCEVAKVFQILEAINYLVSNGDCFIVLGMSEERVRDCVALGFKDLPADFGEETAAARAAHGAHPGTPLPGPHPDAWARQRELAQNYLEKLVQLRIDVPRPDVAGALRLVRSAAAGREAAGGPGGWRSRLAGWWREHRWAVVAALAVAALLAGSFEIGRRVAPTLPREQPKAATAAAAPTAAAPAAGTGSATDAPANASGEPPGGHPYQERGLDPVAVEPGRAGGWSGAIAGGLAALLVAGVWLGERLWQRRRSVVVKDSREFGEACERWSEALLRLQGDKLTPRALKRFKNRVRFYAMMRGDGGEGATRLGGVSDAELVALGAVEQAGLVPPGAVDPQKWDLEAVDRLAVDDGLRREARQVLGRLAGGADGVETMREVRRAVKRA